MNFAMDAYLLVLFFFLFVGSIWSFFLGGDLSTVLDAPIAGLPRHFKPKLTGHLQCCFAWGQTISYKMFSLLVCFGVCWPVPILSIF
jgi:hypothetical protein